MVNNLTKLLFFCGPSGAGQSTLIKIMLRRLEDIGIYDIKYSVSHTTRTPRAGEVDGADYFFVDDETFDKMIAEGQFIEYTHSCMNDRKYGTSIAQLDEIIKTDSIKTKIVVLDLDLDGIENVPTVIENIRNKHPVTTIEFFNILVTTSNLDTCVERVKARYGPGEHPRQVLSEIEKRKEGSAVFFINPGCGIDSEERRLKKIRNLFNLTITNDPCDDVEKSTALFVLMKNVMYFLNNLIIYRIY
jgi:guanylate kinase